MFYLPVDYVPNPSLLDTCSVVSFIVFVFYSVWLVSFIVLFLLHLWKTNSLACVFPRFSGWCAYCWRPWRHFPGPSSILDSVYCLVICRHFGSPSGYKLHPRASTLCLMMVHSFCNCLSFCGLPVYIVTFLCYPRLCVPWILNLFCDKWLICEHSHATVSVVFLWPGVPVKPWYTGPSLCLDPTVKLQSWLYLLPCLYCAVFYIVLCCAFILCHL